MKHKHIELQDTEQTAFQLSVIQLTGFTSLPLLASSVVISQKTNLTDAIVTIVLSNLILWIFRYYIILIGYKDRKSTLDIATDYVGFFGRYFIAIQLLLSTLAWYIAQTTLSSNAITYLLHFNSQGEVDRLIQVSVVLGVISTLLCQEGIVVVRKVSMLAFPVLMIAFIGVFVTTPFHIPMQESAKITLSWLPFEIGTNLGVTADLPTFFRHSKSWKTSLKALVIIQILTLIISLAGLFLGPVVSPWLEGADAKQYVANNNLQAFFLITMIFFSAICANVSNVYSASVGWEILAPRLAGRKEYLILGLGLTSIFILVSNIFSMHYLLETTDTALINLCFILVIGYLIHFINGRSPNRYEKTIYFLGWLVATTINILQVLHLFLPKLSILLTGPMSMFIVIAIGFSMKKIILRQT